MQPLSALPFHRQPAVFKAHPDSLAHCTQTLGSGPHHASSCPHSSELVLHAGFMEDCVPIRTGISQGGTKHVDKVEGRFFPTLPTPTQSSRAPQPWQGQICASFRPLAV